MRHSASMLNTRKGSGLSTVPHGTPKSTIFPMKVIIIPWVRPRSYLSNRIIDRIELELVADPGDNNVDNVKGPARV